MEKLHVRRITTGLVAAGLAVGLSSPAYAATEPAIPANCVAGAFGVNAAGETVQYKYTNGEVSIQTLNFETPLPFQPTTGVILGEAGDPQTILRTEMLLGPDGTLYERDLRGSLTDGQWSYTQDVEVMGTGFDLAIDFEYAYPYVYQLNKWGVGIRYDMTWAPGENGTRLTQLTNPTRIKWALASQIRILSYVEERTHDTAPDGSARVWDAFYAVTRDGGLAAVEIAQDDPQVYTYNVLRESGFKNVEGLSTGWCETADGGAEQQVVLAIGEKGWTRAYYDADPADGSGADLVGGDVIISKDFDDVVIDY